jgi:hypothetical protein
MLQTMNVGSSNIGSVELLAHPRAVSDGLGLCVEATLMRAEGALVAQYIVSGNVAAALRVPELRTAARRDELWRHTCAELFVAVPDQRAYVEFNFSPSSEWAAYGFNAYRDGIHAVEVVAPSIECDRTPTELALKIAVTLPPGLAHSVRLQLGLCMVTEDTSGHCSYWALAHAADQPDFHRRDGFLVTV